MRALLPSLSGLLFGLLMGLPSIAQTPAGPAAASTRQAETLTAHLRQTPLLHAGFTQTRHLAALSRPLRSTGRLVVHREKGVIWQVQKPLALTFIMGPAGLVEVDGNGKAKPQASREAPVVAQMGRIVKSLLRGQWSAVEEHFVIRGAGTPAAWEIFLDPKPALGSFLKQIRVQGGLYLERLQVLEPSGDRMELVFQELRTDLPLSEAETRLYSLR